MNIDDQLTAAFHAKAETATTSPEAYGLIRDRVRAGRRPQFIQIAAATLAVPAIAVAVFVLNDGDDPAPLRPEGSVAPTTPAEPSVAPAPSSSAAASASPSDVPTASQEYADAIAVGVREPTGDRIVFRSPTGEEIGTSTALPGWQITDLEWSPDRASLYISSTGEKTTGCSGDQATVLDIATGKTTVLGEWGGLTFSPDGRQLAYLDYAAKNGPCTAVALVVRDVSSGAEKRYPQPTDTEPSGYSSLTWVPGVNRLVMIEQGPGDGTVVSLLDLDKASSLKDLTMVDTGVRLPGGEDARSLAYVGNRLIIAMNCCLNTDETIRFLARDSSTGRVTELRKQPGIPGGIAHLDVAPDGKQVVYSPYVEGPAWIWDLVGEPRKIADGVSGVAW